MTSPAEPPSPNGFPAGDPDGDLMPVHPRMSRTRFLLGIAVGIVGCIAASAVAFAVYAANHRDPGTFEITGLMNLTGKTTSSSATGFECAGAGGYGDMNSATTVTVSDESGTLLAKGSFTGSSRGTGTCLFTFTVEDVPRGHKFYEVEVGHRGTLSYTEEEAESGLFLSLGD